MNIRISHKIVIANVKPCFKCNAFLVFHDRFLVKTFPDVEKNTTKKYWNYYMKVIYVTKKWITSR